MFRLAIDIAGVKQINRGLMVNAALVKDLRPVWEMLYADLLRKEKQVFARQGSFGSQPREMGGGAWAPWAPLDPAYAARKRAAGYGMRILVRTGRLRDSLTSRGHADAVNIPTPRSLTVGTAVPYASYHQTGTKRMPKREPLRISEHQARFWVRLVHKFLIESGQFERQNP